MSSRQPYRCHQCGWRRWREVSLQDNSANVHPDDLRTGRDARPVSSTELDQLDPVTRRP